MKELKLNKGQVIKSYIELCKLLDVKPTKGQQRDRHIKELDRYCIYHKQGQKFIIDEVFKEPKDKIDGRINNGCDIGDIRHTIYETLMDDLVLKLLSEHKLDPLSFKKIFTEYIPMLSSGYEKYMDQGHSKFAKEYGISPGLVKEYSGFLYGKVKTNFETSLNRLKKQNIITYDKGIEVIRSRDRCSVVANEDEIKMLKECKQKVMEEMGLKSLFISDPKLKKKFKKNVCKEFNSRNNDDIFGYWNVYLFDLVDEDEQEQEMKNISTDIDELIIRFIVEIHKSLENKVCEFNGKSYKPYKADKHKEATYALDRLLWNLPENWYESFIGDYELIFPEDDVNSIELESSEVIPF